MAVGRGARPVVGDEVDEFMLVVEGQLGFHGVRTIGELGVDAVRVAALPGHGRVDEGGRGEYTQRSLNSVTISPRSMTGPAALTIGYSEHSLTRMVADLPTKTCYVSASSPKMVTSIRSRRLIDGAYVLTCSPVNPINGLDAPAGCGRGYGPGS